MAWRAAARAAGTRGGGDVDRGQDAEDVGLHHAGEQAQQGHDDREEEGRNRQQDAGDHRAAHHVAEQAHGERQRARRFADDVERQHQDRRLQVRLRSSRAGPGSRCRRTAPPRRRKAPGRPWSTASRRRFEARQHGAQGRGRHEDEQRADECEVLVRLAQADLLDLPRDARDDDFEQALPARELPPGAELARHERGPPRQHQHQRPGEDNGRVELDEAVLPEDPLVRAKAHGGLRARGHVRGRRGLCQPGHHRAAPMKPSRHSRSVPNGCPDEVETRQDQAHSQQQG